MNTCLRRLVVAATVLVLAVLAAGQAAAVDLQVGSRGADVKRVQEKLADMGYEVGLIDGVYGNRTRGAVRQFQADFGLSVTGDVDDRTYRAIMSAERRPETTAPSEAEPEETESAEVDESFGDFEGFDEGDGGGVDVMFGGFVKSAVATRFGKGDDRFAVYAFIDGREIQFAEDPTSILSAQQNTLHLYSKAFLSSSVSALVAVDVTASPAPERPFTDKVEFEIDEAYLNYGGEKIGLTVGKEKVVWGLMDVISPFKIINSVDMLDPFINSGLEDSRGQWMVHFNYDNVGKFRVEGIFIPIWTQSQMPMADWVNGECKGDFWFPPLFTSIPTLVWDQIRYEDGTVQDVIIGNEFGGLDEPDKDLSSFALAGRLTATLGNFDVGTYFISTYDPKPNPVIHTSVYQGDINFGGNIGVRNVGLYLLNEVEQKYTRVWVGGASAETVVGRFRFKGETALSYGRKFFPDITTSEGLVRLYRDALQNPNTYRGGKETGEKYAALDIQFGSEYTVPVVDVITSAQVGITNRFGHKEEYFGKGTDINLTFYLQKSFGQDQWTSSLASMVETGSGTIVLSPRLKFVPQYVDFLEFQSGMNLFLAPAPEEWGIFKTYKSVTASYRDYSHVFLTVKASFDI